MTRRISMIPYLSIFHFLYSSLDFDTSQSNCLSLLSFVQSLRTLRELGSSADLKQRWYLKMSVRVDGRRITSNLFQPIKQQTNNGFKAEVKPIVNNKIPSYQIHTDLYVVLAIHCTNYTFKICWAFTSCDQENSLYPYLVFVGESSLKSFMYKSR